MPRVPCPHCRSLQEIEAPASGSRDRRTCSSCGRPFMVRSRTQPSTGTTQKLPPPSSGGPPGGAAPAVAAGEMPPVRMGSYEVRGLLGAGGMGVVYRGWDANLGRQVALKTLRANLARDPEYRERFLREARAAAALSHPNVTQIYFIGEENSQPFFAMEFLEGKSLEAIVRQEGKLPPARAVDLVRQAALGLRAAAARGIVHRDVKPSNLVLASDGTLKVTDFGLAKLVVADAGLTLAGEVLGSPNYMAPEQATGQPADHRSDIYSLGATLYELVTGQPPFDGPTPVSILLKHAREPVRNPRQLTPGLPYPLVTLIQKMLAKRPEDRPQDYDLLLLELGRLGTWPGAAAGPSPGRILPTTGVRPVSTPPIPASSRPGRAWIVGPLMVLALLGGWGLLRQAGAPAGSDSREAAAPSASPASGADLLVSRSEVSPPGLRGGRPTRLGGFDIPPRLERLKEAARANLQFVTNTHEIGTDGRMRVLGSVVNTGLGRATDIRIGIVLTDSAGRTLGSTEVPLTPAQLGPRQSGAFEAFFPDPHQPVSIRTELHWNS